MEQQGQTPTANRKRKRSRWGDVSSSAANTGLNMVIPQGLNSNEEQLCVLQLQIEEYTRRLRTGDLGIPANPENRSPSPEPIYNNEGKRLNTREYRMRKKLEDERHAAIQKCYSVNADYKPPSDYKPPLVRVSDKVTIPQEEHPDINFVGLLIGPRGNTLKNLEKETGAKIIIRGKGSVKEGKIGRKDGQPLPGEDEPLHAYVTASIPEHVKIAVDKINEIIKQGIEVPEGHNDLRKQQLRELALLNGTLRENDGGLAKLKALQQAQNIVTNTILCTVCGGTGHIAADCKQKRPGDTFRAMQNQTPADRAKMDIEYMSLMAELGEGPPPPKQLAMPPQPNEPRLNNPVPPPLVRPPWQQQQQQQPQQQQPPQQQQRFLPPMNLPAPVQNNQAAQALLAAAMAVVATSGSSANLLGGQQQQNRLLAPPPPPPSSTTSSTPANFNPWQTQPQQQSPAQQNMQRFNMRPPPPPPAAAAARSPWQQGGASPASSQAPAPRAPWQQTASMAPPPPPPPSAANRAVSPAIPLGVPPPPPPSS